MGFNLDSYEQVKDRIARFYADHADGRLITELVTSPETLGIQACFKASVYLGDTLKATGYAFEAQGQGVNKDAWVENAETSAIGRALANMDYCGTIRPSREEMSKTAPARESVEPDKKARAAELVKLCGIEDDFKRQIWDACSHDIDKFIARLEDELKRMG